MCFRPSAGIRSSEVSRSSRSLCTQTGCNLVQSLRIARRVVPRTDELVAVPARNHVDVELEDVLPSGSPVRLEEGHAVWGEDLVQATSNRKRQGPDGSRRVLV
jgi:hypothetical protein